MMMMMMMMMMKMPRRRLPRIVMHFLVGRETSSTTVLKLPSGLSVESHSAKSSWCPQEQSTIPLPILNVYCQCSSLQPTQKATGSHLAQYNWQPTKSAEQQQMLFTKNITNLVAGAQRRLLSVANVALNLIPSSNSGNTKQIMNETSEDKLLNSKGNKQIKIRACGKLYQQLSKTRPVHYGGAPKDGIEFTVQYYDNLELLDREARRPDTTTVCLLHGAPGHYKEFSSLISFLTVRGVRVIAPNFPDYNATYQHSFRHSPAERLDFLLQFFKALQVKSLDLLIGHSSAVYTMFELLDHSLSNSTNDRWANLTTSQGFQVHVNSLGLFSTPSHELPSNLAVTPFRLFALKLFDFEILRPLILGLILTFVKLQGIRNRVDVNKIENLLIAASAVGYSEHQRMAGQLGLLRRHKIPTLLVYGTQDRLISTSAFEQLERDLGLRDRNLIKSYKSDGQVETDSQGRELVRVSRFNSGGHYAFQRYARQVNEDVYSFLLESELETTRL